MNFKEEYIKAAEEFTPDRQTIDRMKANVLNMTRTKRVFPFKKAAAVGGAAAACAVITFAAVRIVPNLSANSDNMIEHFALAGGSADSTNNCADAVDICLDETIEFDAATEEWCEDTACTTEIYDDSEIEAMPAEAEEIMDKDDGSGGEPPADTPASSAHTAAPASEDTAAVLTDPIVESDQRDFPSCAASESCSVEMNAEPSDAPISDTVIRAFFEGYTLTISEDRSECTLTDGERQYSFRRRLSEELPDIAEDPTVPYAILTNTTDNRTCYVAFADNILIIRDENYNLTELFV